MQTRFKNRSQETRALASALLILVGLACQVQTFKHDPIKAAENGNIFLKALYLDEDPYKAFEFSDPQLKQSATPNNLLEMTAAISRQYGKLTQLRADSYLMKQGQTIELFYVGTYDKGTLYHRIVLIGDATVGYKVSGVWFQPEAYPEQPLRRKFDHDMFVY